jgi:hypothetical protein
MTALHAARLVYLAVFLIVAACFLLAARSED